MSKTYQFNNRNLTKLSKNPCLSAITSPPVILGRLDQRLKTPEVGPRRQMNC